MYLIGDELFAKAIIKKGQICLINDQETGRKCYIVDENQQICKSEHTGIYLNNKYINCDKETGLIYIPEAVESYQDGVWFTHDGITDNAYLEVKSSNYSLNFTTVFNSEEVIAGRTAKFLFPM